VIAPTATPPPDPPAAASPQLTLLQQQRRRLRFIHENRLSRQEVTDHVPWDFDPGPEYDTP